MQRSSLYIFISGMTFSMFILFYLYSCQSRNKQNGEQTLNYANHIIKKEDTTDYFFMKGEKLFLTDCGTCHAGKNKTDNYLAGVVQRLGEEYLITYLTKQDSLINSKDRYALKLKEVYGSKRNSHNFKYNSDQLNSVIEYLR